MRGGKFTISSFLSRRDSRAHSRSISKMPGTPRNFRLFDYSYYYVYLAKIVIYTAAIIKPSLPNRRSSFSSFERLRRIASLRPRRSLPLAGGQPSLPNFGVQQSVGTSSFRCRKISRRPDTQLNPEESNSHPTNHDHARITTLTETRFSSSPPAVQTNSHPWWWKAAVSPSATTGTTCSPESLAKCRFPLI